MLYVVTGCLEIDQVCKTTAPLESTIRGMAEHEVPCTPLEGLRGSVSPRAAVADE